VVKALTAAVISSLEGILNIGTGESVCLGDISTTLAEILGEKKSYLVLSQ
jgi:hypothetical protein